MLRCILEAIIAVSVVNAVPVVSAVSAVSVVEVSVVVAVMRLACEPLSFACFFLIAIWFHLQHLSCIPHQAIISPFRNVSSTMQQLCLQLEMDFCCRFRSASIMAARMLCRSSSIMAAMVARTAAPVILECKRTMNMSNAELHSWANMTIAGHVWRRPCLTWNFQHVFVYFY